MANSLDDLQTRIADEVRIELTRQRLTQAQLAARIGSAQSVISRKLCGKAPITTRDVERWAAALDVPVSRLMPSIDTPVAA